MANDNKTPATQVAPTYTPEELKVLQSYLKNKEYRRLRALKPEVKAKARAASKVRAQVVKVAMRNAIAKATAAGMTPEQYVRKLLQEVK